MGGNLRIKPIDLANISEKRSDSDAFLVYTPLQILFSHKKVVYLQYTRKSQFMEKRTVKEYKLDNNNVFQSKYGTLNKNNPSVIYVKSRGKIVPLIEKNTYIEDVADIKESLTAYVDRLVKNNDEFQNRYIFNIDTGDNALKYNRKSYFKYDVYLVPIEIKPLDDYEETVNEMSMAISGHLETLLKEKNIGY